MGNASFISLGLAAALAMAAGSAATAQEAAPSLTLELNALQPSERGCRFVFVATNELGGELSNVAYELVLFDKAGQVSRITVASFKDLPRGKTKVRQFDFPEVDCSDLSRVLINDATECAGPGIEPDACIRHLRTETRTGAKFGA